MDGMLWSIGLDKHLQLIKENASLNVKRVSDWSEKNWYKDGEDPYLLLEGQEVKIHVFRLRISRVRNPILSPLITHHG